MTTFAVIPAAGKSSRMGRPKLTLPFRGKTVLECVIGALRDAGIQHVLVVIGSHAPQLVPVAESAGALVLRLEGETADMRASVEQGLRWLEGRFQPKDEDAWLLAPADHPALDADVIRQLIVARTMNPEQSIIVPTYKGKRGHPALIGWKHVSKISGLPAGTGIDWYLRETGVFELPLESESIVIDLDSPADYERLRRDASTRSL